MSADQSFGTLAKNRRRELGLTQDELARRVGCAPITIRKIDADDYRPSVQIAERMAMALNIPLEERAAFVKLARVELTPAEEPKITPMPSWEEIGNEDLTGRAIRGYALGERLGNGGMGAVYRAIQPLVEREVAIKIILPKFANHSDFIRRFEAEAQLVARLEHPHIVPLYDYWREPNVAYLVMRLLRGGSIQSLLKNGTALPPETVLHLIEQIGSALGAAHRAGVVHRDLKPANVLLDEDNNAYLADFGIAKNLSSFTSETQADVVLGSPDYISPEQIKAEFVRPQTDIYALGVMLYELLTGTVPFHGPTPFEVMHQHLTSPLPPLSASRVGLPGSVDEVIKHATAKDPLQRYETVEEMLSDLRGALEGKSKVAATHSQSALVPLKETDNPYKGLRAFGEGDAQDFFGREALLQQLLIRLGESGELSRFLTVVGPSGSGKSSVVKAGLIPALRRGALPGSDHWFIIEMLPGAHPLEELEAALLRVAVNPPSSLMEQFQRDNRGLIRAVRRSLPVDPNIELVLVIDQFEEVFTLVQDENERIRFLGLLVAAALDETSRIRIIVTVRADFIDRPLAYMDFGEILRQRMEIVLPLTTDETESAIASPAERVGLHLEPGLIPTMMHDLADQPGALPLLQFALTELFEKREANTLTKSAYQQIGGVLGALGRRTEEVYNGLNSECQEIARQLFLRLVTLGEGVEDTRRRALIAELESLQLDGAISSKEYSRSFKTTLDAFGRARLLSFDRDPGTRGPTVEVAHEAILREWSRLREWLNESRTLVRMQRQLALEATEWDSANRDESFLLTGTKLSQYDGWLENTPVALTEHELEFLKVSHSAREEHEVQELARQERELENVKKLAETERQSAMRLRNRNRIITGIGAIALGLAILAGIFAVYSNQNAIIAEQQSSIALGAQATAQAETQIRATQQAIAEENFTRAEAQRLGAEALNAFNSNASAETIALLSIHALHMQYSPQADEALLNAAQLVYPERLYTLPEPVHNVALSPDGHTIVTIGTKSNIVYLIDMDTAQILKRFEHPKYVNRASFSPDGRFILTDATNIERIWDVETGQVTQQFNANLPFVSSITYSTFSQDGESIYMGITNSVIKWNIESGKEEQRWNFTNTVFGISVYNHLALTYNSGYPIKIWDLETGNLLYTLASTGDEFVLRICERNKLVLIGYAGGIIKIFDSTSGTLVQTLQGHSDPVESLYCISDSNQILTGSDDHTVRLWDVQTGRELNRFHEDTAVFSVAMTPDGQHVFTISGSGADNTIRMWASRSKLVEFPVFKDDGIINSVAFLQDGKKLATGGASGVKIRDLQKSEIIYQFPAETYINWGLEFSPDGRYLAGGDLNNSGSGVIHLWDIQTGQEIRRFSDANLFYINDLAFSPDGLYLFGVSQGFTLDIATAAIWDVKTGRKLFPVVTNQGTFYGADYSPNGNTLISAHSSGKAILWNAHTGRLIRVFGNEPGALYTAKFSPNGNMILTAGESRIAHLWDIQTGQEIRQFVGHTDKIFRAAFSSDGLLLATTSADGTVRLWEVATGRELRRYIGHTKAVEDVAFSPDGTYLASVGDDGTTRFWDVDYHTTIQYLCSQLKRDLTDTERQEYGITDTLPTCPKP